MDPGFIFLVILAFITGIAAGYLSGLLGIGSGIILVPAAIFFLDLEFKEAKALSLFVIMFTSPLGMLRHHKHGNLHMKTGLYLGVPGICGSLIGVYIAGIIDATYLIIAFAFLQFYTAYRMIFGGKGFDKTVEMEKAYEKHKKHLPLVGFTGGLAAGALGIGGGVIMVPSMVLLWYPIHSAVANSLMVIFLNSSASTVAHILRGELEVIKAIPLMLGAVLSVQKGADLSVSIDRKKLRRYFGFFMIIVGLYMLYKGLT